MEYAEQQKEDDLNGRVDVDPSIGDVAQVLVVGLVLVTDKEKLEPLEELDTAERGHTQVQHQAIQNRKWEELQDVPGHHRDTDEDGHEEESNPLFSDII